MESLEIFLLLGLIGISFGQIPTFGRCPDIPVVQNFDTKFVSCWLILGGSSEWNFCGLQYLGKWYEIEKYFTVFEIGGVCITADYTDMGNGTIGVRNRQIQTM